MVGIVADGSAAQPTIALLIGMFFVYVFMSTKPYTDDIDDQLAIMLSWSVVLLFLGTLLIKGEE